MKSIAFIFTLFTITVNAQKIEPGVYTRSSFEGGTTFDFHPDKSVTHSWFCSAFLMEGVANYTLTDSQLILSYIQHPLDTFTPEIAVEYNDQVQKDSIEIAILLIDPLGSFSFNLIVPDNYLALEPFNNSFYKAKFKVSVTSLPYTIITSLANCLYSNSISVIIEKPLNTYIGIDTSPYSENNFDKYLKQGRKDTFDIKDITAEGFSIIENKESETPSFTRYIKQ